MTNQIPDDNTRRIAELRAEIAAIKSAHDERLKKIENASTFMRGVLWIVLRLGVALSIAVMTYELWIRGKT